VDPIKLVKDIDLSDDDEMLNEGVLSNFDSDEELKSQHHKSKPPKLPKGKRTTHRA
jgi:hypothetical protein